MDVIKIGKVDRFENSRPDLWQEIQEMVEQPGRAEFSCGEHRSLLRKLAQATELLRRAA